VIDAPVAFQAITDVGFRYEQLRLAWVGFRLLAQFSYRRSQIRKFCTLPGGDLPGFLDELLMGHHQPEVRGQEMQ
jgi:hypothetical protein